MRIYLSVRHFDGTDNINIIFSKDGHEEIPVDFQKWLSAVDVWNYCGKLKSDKYELPNTMKNFLYSLDFDVLVKRFFGNSAEIIRS